jgi:hypothetical protein
MRRTLILVAVVALSTVAAGVGVASVARPAGAALPATTGFGAGLLIKSQIDNNYCIGVPGNTGEGRPLSLQQCSLSPEIDTQQWTFTHNANGTNFIVESLVGMCIDGHVTKATQGQAVTVAQCGFTGVWRFTVLPSGLIEDVANHRCIAVPGAAVNATVTLDPCDETVHGQLWKLAH